MDQQNDNGKDDSGKQSHSFSPTSLPITPSSPRSYRLPLRNSYCPASPPRAAVVTRQGQTLIAPNSNFARAVVMGNTISENDEAPRTDTTMRQHGPDALVSQAQQRGVRRSTSGGRRHSQPKPQIVSNLTVLLNQQQQQHDRTEPQLSEQQDQLQHIGGASRNGGTSRHLRKSSNTSWSPTDRDEADSASGPPPPPPPACGRSAPDLRHSPEPVMRQLLTEKSYSAVSPRTGERVRKCMSSKELGTLAPPSGSPYAYMLTKKSELEVSMRQRLSTLRESAPDNLSRSQAENECLSTTSSTKSRKESTNQMRNRRRAQHAQAVIDDLCEVVADLFIAESKLLDLRNYGVSTNEARTTSVEREQITKPVHDFVSSLPLRYALGADTPSEVLLHMRLMAAARSDKSKAALHIHSLEDDSNWSLTVTANSARNNRSLRLVTISCRDTTGLLEYISKLLATGGSRVLDADVMLSTDGIVLDRFVVEMTGRLRLDRLADLIEAFLLEAAGSNSAGSKNDGDSQSSSSEKKSSPPGTPISVSMGSGPLYYMAPRTPDRRTPQHIQQAEMESAIPLTEVLASNSQADLMGPSFPELRKRHSMPPRVATLPAAVAPPPEVRLQMRSEPQDSSRQLSTDDNILNASSPRERTADPNASQQISTRERRPLVNRRGSSDFDRDYEDSSDDGVDFVTVPGYGSSAGVENRVIPLIPFEELMLIETIGTGRVSTIYRAAWQRDRDYPATTALANGGGFVQMVALKVAMVNSMTGDTSHVDELRREADIAARLKHTNICDLVGVAADPECFCIAYDYCEGGSLLSLLMDTTRYYEYLPIALDIANGMAYLHSRSVIHRDLKPSNILLTRDHRAQIADFGMSVANNGQELTAETGTYRYMSPEVIRHESYSTGADVYSFGVCLWQLITRQVPFSSMTPIQAAYAVAEGRRPEIPASTPRRLQEIILLCWDQDSRKRPSFTYIAMALADYAKMAFSPANVGAQTLQIANEMLATVEGNSTVNVDFTTPVASADLVPPPYSGDYGVPIFSRNDSVHSNVGLEIE